MRSNYLSAYVRPGWNRYLSIDRDWSCEFGWNCDARHIFRRDRTQRADDKNRSRRDCRAPRILHGGNEQRGCGYEQERFRLHKCLFTDRSPPRISDLGRTVILSSYPIRQHPALSYCRCVTVFAKNELRSANKKRDQVSYLFSGNGTPIWPSAMRGVATHSIGKEFRHC